MMKLGNIEFFNIDNLEEYNGGYILNRFPLKLMNSLGSDTHQRGRFYSRRAIGSEIRFKTLSPFFDITIGSVKEDLTIHIYIGDYSFKKYIIKDSTERTIHVEIPDNFLKLRDNFSYTYSPYLIRVIIGYPGYAYFKKLDTFGYKLDEIQESDKPSKTLLIYGSSISHGSEANDYISSSAFILSRILNIEVLNKSIPGSCQAEYDMIKYLNTLNFDKIFVEYGVNILKLLEKDEYKKRLQNIVDIFNDKLYLTTIYDNSQLYINDLIKEYRKVIEDIDLKKSTFIKPDILSFKNLSCDLIHPSESGQLEIALNLSEKIKL